MDEDAIPAEMRRRLAAAESEIAVLRASEARHRLLIESWAQAEWETDAAGFVVADSPSWRAYTGQTLEAWLGYGWLDAVHPGDRAHAERQWREAIAARRPVNAEFRLRTPEGGWRWTNVRAAPVLDADERIEKWVGVNIDIDARKRAEEALREREADLARVQRTGQVGGLDIDVASGLTSRRSPEYLRLHGLPKDDLDETHAGWRARLYPDDRPAAEQALFDALDGVGASYESEYRIVRPNDGAVRWIAARADIERNADGKAVRLVGAHVDITEQKRAQEALRQSEGRLHLALEATNLAVYDWDLVSDRLTTNERFRELVGIAPGEPVIGAKVMENCVHPDDRARVDPDLERAMNGAGDGRFVFDHRLSRVGPLGHPWVLSHGQVSFGGPDDARHPVRVFGTLQDITERKQAEMAARESEERQSFLLRFSDALRAETSADAAAYRGISMVLQRLELDRCYLASYRLADDRADITHQVGTNGVPPMPAEIRLSDFPEAFREVFDRTLVVDDVAKTIGLSETDRQNMAALGFGSFAAPTLRRGEKNPLWVLVAVSGRPKHWSASDIALLEDASERTWAAMERTRAEADLRESEERFRQFADASAAGLWIRDASTLAMEFVSPAINMIYGVEPDALLGDVKHWAAMIVPDDREIAMSHLERARGGETVLHEFRIQRPSDGAFRWIRNTDFPLRDNGAIPRIGGIAEDVTETRRLTEHQSVLLAELQHRVRNIMGMIRSMANRTVAGAKDVADYRVLLEGRLLALARVQALLTREANAGGSLRSILDSEIAAQAHHGGQYELTGPDVRLSPKAVEVLTLAFHELATNALKYGALSVPDGRLTVSWQPFEKRGRPWLALDWTEAGAPAREPSTRRGFGSELIEARIPYELGGRGTIVLEPNGARCRLEFPLKEGESILETDAPQPTTTFGGTLDMTGAPDLSGRTVLVVEDDYYMASDTAAALRGAGAQVLGPCPDAEAARDLLESERPTHAVLDLNLGGGGPRFEVARLLRSRGVPFVFLTGYDPDVIPADMQDVMRLQKPLPFLTIVEAISQL